MVRVVLVVPVVLVELDVLEVLVELDELVELEVPVLRVLRSTSVRSWAALRTDTPDELATLVTRLLNELSGCATA